MKNEIILAIVQGLTEFFPISSSGHLALTSKLLGEQIDLFFITALHIASLIAVLIFTRKEIFELLTFKKEYNKIWIFLIIATIPGAIAGYFLEDIIEKSFDSLLFLGLAFLFTGFVLSFTIFKFRPSTFNYKNSLIIGLFQVLALFPGVSRSGMTISAAIFSGIEREKAVKFSFLLFIPLAIGAFALESSKAYFNTTLIIALAICLITSLISLYALNYIVKKRLFWIFSIYCLVIGIIILIIQKFL